MIATDKGGQTYCVTPAAAMRRELILTIDMWQVAIGNHMWQLKTSHLMRRGNFTKTKNT